MFFPTSEPGSPEPRRFAALRTSLNAPVVSTAELPSGPARAAIVLWFEDDQSCVLEVRVSSLTTGRLVAYAWEGDLADAREVETALDAGLSFAESMGFLFDDDVLSSENTIGREKVVAAWEAFEAGLAGEPGAVEPDASATVSDADLLELTELAPEADLGGGGPDLSDELNVELASDGEPEELEGAPVPPAAPEVPEVLEGATLTKFRSRLAELESAQAQGAAAAGADSLEGASVGGAKQGLKAALGRVPLVRRRRPGVELAEPKADRGGLLARILGAF